MNTLCISLLPSDFKYIVNFLRAEGMEFHEKILLHKFISHYTTIFVLWFITIHKILYMSTKLIYQNDIHVCYFKLTHTKKYSRNQIVRHHFVCVPHDTLFVPTENNIKYYYIRCIIGAQSMQRSMCTDFAPKLGNKNSTNLKQVHKNVHTVGAHLR